MVALSGGPGPETTTALYKITTTCRTSAIRSNSLLKTAINAPKTISPNQVISDVLDIGWKAIQIAAVRVGIRRYDGGSRRNIVSRRDCFYSQTADNNRVILYHISQL